MSVSQASDFNHSDPRASTHYFPLIWLLLVSVTGFGIYVAADFNALTAVINIDKSYMASAIMTLVVVMTVHCGWHVIVFSRDIHSAQQFFQAQADTATVHSPRLTRYLNDVRRFKTDNTQHGETAFDIVAEKIRSPVDIGWFFVDFTVRLGLLGTIIGFILIFASLNTVNIAGGGNLKDLLLMMSGGMGTALLTTLTGLIGASLLSFQYLILSRESEYLVELLFRIERQTHSEPQHR